MKKEGQEELREPHEDQRQFSSLLKQRDISSAMEKTKMDPDGMKDYFDDFFRSFVFGQG